MSYPLLFRPYLKTVIWGGEKIEKFKNETIGLEKLGESWELSAVPGCESTVVNGPLAGKTLSELVDEQGASLMGRHVAERYGKTFPLLVKFIDANGDLSVQVHPNDELAARRHNSLGKSEMWYVIDADRGAKIHAGLSRAFSPEQYDAALADDTIMSAVQSHEARPGQFFYIPAGTVHALGAGCLIAEIQQSSDVTYRVYDYNRVEAATGKPRALHTAEAREAIDYRYPNEITPMGDVFERTHAGAVRSEYFTVDYVQVAEGEPYREEPVDSFRILVVVEGELQVGELTVPAGHTVLLPADLAPQELSGAAKVLRAYV